MPADERFCQRVERIERGRQWRPDGVLMAGDATPRLQEEGAARRRRRSRKRPGPLALLAALLAGAGAALGGRLASFLHAGEAAPWGAQGAEIVARLGPLGSGVALAVALAILLRLHRGMLPVALVAGFAAWTTAEPEALALLPERATAHLPPDYLVHALEAEPVLPAVPTVVPGG